MAPGKDASAPDRDEDDESQPATKDGRTARRTVSRKRIERAATELFAEFGYNGSTLDDIAAKAGVSKGTIFYNYKNKAVLFERILLRAVIGMSEQISEARGDLYGWAAFEAATLRVVEQVDEYPSQALIVVNELFRQLRPWQDSLPEARATLLAPLREIIREVGEERVASNPAATVTPREDADNVAMSVLGALVVATLDRRAFVPTRTNEQIHRTLMQAVSGLRAVPPGGGRPPAADEPAHQ